MKKVKLLILAALAVMMSATSFAADADFPARPDTAIFVNDFAGVLRQSKVIDDSLRAFSKRTTNQIMVITVKDLGDYEPKMYAAELGDRWGIGQAKLDNGLIIL
ncbi:MAG: TPM domain-containing protein, partial [Sodaliphilus sp.]|nr:TPM domain-containing protein [Sodaliphilus sp.]